MNYNETMDYIKNTAKFGSNYGLSRTKKILEILGNPEKKLKCIHIAGTNGKGSTTAMITQILREAGYKVGMYTSPFLIEFEERIQINGQNISKDDLCEIVSELKIAVDKVIALGFEHPTEFEIITCAGFLYFYKQGVDFAVIEVGLGGRLDSTNVINPLLSVITSISYDHMNILGTTLTEIAGEKAGIIKENTPVITYPQEAESYKVIEKVCKERKCKLVKVNKDSAVFIKSGEENGSYFQNIQLKTERSKYDIKLSLLGKHQILNCSTAVYCIEELIELGASINKENIEEALNKVTWMGRLEVLQHKPTIVIDGAHNMDGIKNLNESIDIYFKYKKLYLILGILHDKEVEKMVEIIAKRAEKIITVSPHNIRAENSESLENIVKKYNENCESIDDYREAIDNIKKCCTKEDLILISGSLYMIGDMRKILT